MVRASIAAETVEALREVRAATETGIALVMVATAT
jgi:hypothetical protein